MRWSFWLGFCATALTVSVSAAVEVHPSLKNAITRALQKPLAVNFQQTQLKDVLQTLATEAGVPYRIHEEALQEAKISSSTPVTFLTVAQPIAESLQEILSPLLLDLDTRTDELVITTSTHQAESLDQRMYDVSQLVQLIQPRLRSIEVHPNPYGVDSGADSEKPRNETDELNRASGFFSGGRDGRGFFGDHPEYQRAEFRVPMKVARHRFPAEYVLMTILQENTSGQWADIDGVGGWALLGPGRIFLCQTVTVHHQIFDVLTHLERILEDPKAHANTRLGEDEVDRQRRAALDRILDTISEVPAGTMPLEKWIDLNLRAQGVIIRIDHESLEEDNVDLQNIVIHFRPGVTLRKLLNDALDGTQVSLRYYDKHFMLLSLANADEVLSTMIFDVSDLPEAGDPDWLNEYLFSSTSGQWEDVDGVGGTAHSCGISGLLFVRQSEQVLEEVTKQLSDLRRPLEIPAKPLQAQRTRSIYTLPDITTATDLQTVLPKLVDLPDATWPEDAIQRVGTLLIIQQTEFVHRRIETVIEAIRKAHEAKPVDPMP